MNHLRLINKSTFEDSSNVDPLAKILLMSIHLLDEDDSSSSDQKDRHDVVFVSLLNKDESSLFDEISPVEHWLGRKRW